MLRRRPGRGALTASHFAKWRRTDRAYQPVMSRRAGGEMSSWHKLRAFSLTSRCKPRLEDKGPCLNSGAPRPVGDASILSKILVQKKSPTKVKANHIHPRRLQQPQAGPESPPRRRAPRDRGRRARRRCMPTGCPRRRDNEAAARGPAATATRTTSTHISSRSRSHKWQP